MGYDDGSLRIWDLKAGTVQQTVSGKYSRTSITRTSLGLCKFVLDMGSLSHLGLIIKPGQEAN